MLPSIEWLDKKLQEMDAQSDEARREELAGKIVNDLQAYSEEDWNSLAQKVEEEAPEWNLLLIPCLKKVICQEAFLQLAVLSQSEFEPVRKAASMAVINYEGFANGKYRHYKGNCYEVLGVGRNTENKDWMIVYRSIANPHHIWCRPANMWLEVVRDGETRFTRIEE